VNQTYESNKSENEKVEYATGAKVI